jgi:hypothetical protein
MSKVLSGIEALNFINSFLHPQPNMEALEKLRKALEEMKMNENRSNR